MASDKALTIFSLTEARPSSTAQSIGDSLVLWIPSDVAYTLRLSPGALCLVALSDKTGAPVSLIQSFSKTNLNTNSNSKRVGDFCVLAECWPDPRLQQTNGAVSPMLHNALGQPKVGSSLSIYHYEVCDISADESNELHIELCMDNSASDGTPGKLLLQVTEVEVADTQDAQSIKNTTPGRSISNKVDQRGRPPVKGTPSPGGRRKSGGTDSDQRTSASLTGANPSPQKQSLQNNPQVEFLLTSLNDPEAGSGLKRVIELLAKRCLLGRFCLAGNLIAVPIIGANVLFRVSSSTASAISLGTSVTLDAPKDKAGSSYAGYSTLAGDAAANALGGGKGGVAYTAAYHAALAGERSLGTTYANLGGCELQATTLQELVGLPLRAHLAFKQYHITAPRGILLHGPSGTGKTALARAAATEAKAALFVLNGPDIVSEFFGESELGLKAVFSAACSLAPSVIFIDEIDAIAPSREHNGGIAGVSGRLVTTLLTELDALHGHSVVVLGATNRLQAVDPNLRRPGRFDRELEIDVPSPSARRDILKVLLARTKCSISDEQALAIADSAHGFVGADLAALCSEAAMARLRYVIGGEPGTNVTYNDFLEAERCVRPSGLREITLEKPNVTWTDVGGLESVKRQLREAVDLPFRAPDILSKLGVEPPRGVLLYGPPGCSKTLIARAVAAESGLNFFSVKGPELYSKYVGESEKALAALFKKARSSCPSVVFFDEIDGMVTSRAANGSGHVAVENRVLSQLLQEMDGLHKSTTKPVIVIAATNRPDSLDSALLRPGRFDRLLYVPPPDISAREAIFQVHTRRMPLAGDVDFSELAKLTEGYTGAEIASVCQQAGFVALERNPSVNSVEMLYFVEAVRKVQPSLKLQSSIFKRYEAFSRRCDIDAS